MYVLSGIRGSGALGVFSVVKRRDFLVVLGGGGGGGRRGCGGGQETLVQAALGGIADIFSMYLSRLGIFTGCHQWHVF